LGSEKQLDLLSDLWGVHEPSAFASR
jgi:hypothetical protein